MIDFESAPGEGGSSGPFAPRPSSRPQKPAGYAPAFLQALNPSQREAVEATDGPLIVLAGAGSGKTKMLTSRIAYLVDARAVAPQHILAVTFTNKAAGEMRERVEKLLHGSGALGSPEIGTFHSVCVRILRRELGLTPFTKPFVIYDDSDQLSLIKRSIEKLGIDEKAFNAKAMRAAIDRAKCDALEPHEVKVEPHDLWSKQFQRVYDQYQKDLFASNALDFGEIICMTYRILRDHPDARRRYQQRYRYIHVDEYQDTNRAQYLLLTMLARSGFGGHENICVVGDEDQSIYKWRGADIRNILDFEKDYPGARVVKLEQNYRSTKTIIGAASTLIRNNRERKDKTLWTDNEQGMPIIRAHAPDERAEAEFVIHELKRLASDQGRAYGDFAIFYRTHAQSRQFEDVLRREKIPYQIVGGLRFYDRKEIKDILSYFRVVLNTADGVGLKRILNVPGRGIGKTTVDKLEALQTHIERDEGLANGAFWEALRRAAGDPSFTNAGTARKIASFVGIIERLIESQPAKSIAELYHQILDETGYVLSLKEEGTDEALSRIENLEEFDSLLQEFEEDFFASIPESDEAGRKSKYPEMLPLFIEQSSLATDTERQQEQGSVVSMMSLHSSKGLEFPVVFLVGMEEGLFPSLRPWEDTEESEVEEERRLCYVGMTRAREVLYLSHVTVRRLWGDVSYQEPARFFQEIPGDAMDFRDLSRGGGAQQFRMGSARQFGGYSAAGSGRGASVSPAWSSGSGFGSSSGSSRAGAFGAAPPAAGDPWVGRRILHPDYGRGTILLSEGSGDQQKVIIEFGGKSRKKFLLRFIREFLDEE